MAGVAAPPPWYLYISNVWKYLAESPPGAGFRVSRYSLLSEFSRIEPLSQGLSQFAESALGHFVLPDPRSAEYLIIFVVISDVLGSRRSNGDTNECPCLLGFDLSFEDTEQPEQLLSIDGRLKPKRIPAVFSARSSRQVRGVPASNDVTSIPPVADRSQSPELYRSCVRQVVQKGFR